MTRRNLLTLITRSILLVPCIGLLLSLGCSSSSPEPATMFLNSFDKPANYSQTFPRTYATRNPDGEYDIVLIDDAIGHPAHTSPGKPLMPTQWTGLRQIVHIRVSWSPVRGVKPDFPAATNSSVSWYILGNRPGLATDMLHYQGIGFVSVYPQDNGIRIYLRNTSLSLQAQRGNLIDPLGRCGLNGEAFIPFDPAHVQNTLTDLNLALNDTPQ